MKIAHISDLHMTSLDGVTWTQLLNKRILGYLAWHYKRRHIHKRETLNQIIRFIQGEQPDLLAITGDLTQIGTKQEYKEAHEWMKKTAQAFNIAIVPGNHDCYSPTQFKSSIGLWRDYYPRDNTSEADNELLKENLFPTQRTVGNVVVIGVNTALPTAPLLATGKIGASQMKQLSRILSHAKQQGLFRLIMLHHGPVCDTCKNRRRLVDADEFCSLLKKCGAEMVLHGHEHNMVEHYIETTESKIPVFSVPSASASPTAKYHGAGYNLYDIHKQGAQWEIQRRSMLLDQTSQSVQSIEEKRYLLPV